MPWQSFTEEPNVRDRHDWLYTNGTEQVRYIKFVSHKVANGGYGLRLWEVEAYGEGNGHLAGGIEDINVNGNIYLAGDVVVMPVVMSKAGDAGCDEQSDGIQRIGRNGGYCRQCRPNQCVRFAKRYVYSQGCRCRR